MDSIKMVLIFSVVALSTVIWYQNHVLSQQDKVIQVFMQSPACGLLIQHSKGGVR